MIYSICKYVWRNFVFVLSLFFILAILIFSFGWIVEIGEYLYPEEPNSNAEVVKLALSIIGGVGVLLGLYIAHKRAVITEKTVANQSKQLEHAQKSQIDERFKNAVEHLGSEKEAVILGGVVELHQIAQENSQAYGKVVFNILTSYIRSQTNITRVESKDIKSAVIQTICDYLFKNKNDRFYPYEGCIANLENVNLHSVNLDYADLSHVKLYNSYLPSSKHTNYTNSDLTSCDFFEGRIENCDFHGANMFQSKFRFLDFIDSSIGSTDLLGCQFYYSKIDNLRVLHGLSSCLFYRTILSSVVLPNTEIAGNQFIECNLFNIDFTKSDLSLCDFSLSGFYNCDMPKNLYRVKFSSVFNLKNSYYLIFEKDFLSSSFSSFSINKSNETDLTGIGFKNDTQKTNCIETDLSEQERKDFDSSVRQKILIDKYKKYSEDLNEIIELHIEKRVNRNEKT